MRVFTYNTINGINPFSDEDYGSITSAAANGSEDYSYIFPQTSSEIPYGDISVNENNFSSTNVTFDGNLVPETFDNYFIVREDYSYIIYSETILPFGSISIQQSDVSAAEINSYLGTGTLFNTGVVTENVIFVWDGNGTLFEIGHGLDRTLRPYVASGTLRMDQTVAETALEKVSYSYNIFSTLPSNLDYGSIANITGEIIDNYGQLDENFGSSIDDYAFIINPVLPIIPFGKISVTGSAEFYPNYRLYFDGQAQVKIVYSEVFVGTITFSDYGIESRTYVYDNTSIFSAFEDLGLISTPTTLDPEDNGFVASIHDPFVDNGFISTPIELVPLNPFGSISISTSFAESREIQVYGLNPGEHLYPQPADTSSGTIFLSGNLVHPDIDYTPSYSGNGTIEVSGAAIESYIAQTPEDTQLLIISGTSIESNTESYVGIGAGYFSGTGLEVYSAQTPENTQLFTISGTPIVHPEVDLTPHYGIEKNIGIGTTAFIFTGFYTNLQASFAWLGTGTLFSLDFGRESRTYVYNEFVDINAEDWQLITGIATDFADLGFISNVANNFENYGELNVTSGLKPFGTINLLNGLSPQEQYPWLPGPGVGRSWNYTRKGYIGDNPVYTLSGIASTREIAVYQDFVPSGLFTISGNLIHPNIDLTPHYGIEENIGIGTTGIQITGLSTAIEKFIGEPLINTQLFVYSSGLFISTTDVVPSDLKATYSEVGVGTFTFVGEKLESDIDSYDASGIITISGTGLESYSAQTPEDTVLFNFDENKTGQYSRNSEYISDNPPPIIITNTPLVHPDVRLIPHYGIEKNIGIGTTGVQFGVGVGTFPDGDGNPRDAKTYSNRYGFRIGDFNSGSGIGTFKFDQTNNIAKYSPLTPYTGTGLFNIITGFSPQVQYPYAPLGIGKSWSFTRTPYTSSGIATISGIASTREIAVYGYYGNDVNPGTSGTIFISQQTSPIVEIEINSYVGSGTAYLGFEISEGSYSETDAYFGSGTLTISASAQESFSLQDPENIQLFSISGSSLEVYSAQTPETEVLYVINGFIEESITNSYEGSGSTNLSGNSSTFFIPNYPARGLFRFVQHNVDNDYDTCDSEEITSDGQDSAYVSFTANPEENTILFEFNGSAITAESDLHEYVGFGLYTLFGTYQNIKLTHSESGIGTIFVTSTTLESESNVYSGSGSLFALSGKSESYSAQTPESTIILQIFGSATTSIESDYPVVGIGLFALGGTAITSEIATYSQVGSGFITLSGQLVYPDVIFIPSPDGFGTINIFGSSNESLSRIYDDTSGTLFAFSSGFESFAKSTYTGIGTIYIQELSGSTINNPFQIPRTYVVII
jgi:hypothetical protein